MSQANRIDFQKLARTASLPLILFTLFQIDSKAQLDIAPLLQEAGLNMKQNQFNTALDLYLEAANLAPDDWRPYQGAGNAFFKLDDLDHSLQYYREALALKGQGANLVKKINQIEVAIFSRAPEAPPGQSTPDRWEPDPASARDSSPFPDPSPAWAARVEALESQSRQKQVQARSSLAAKFSPGRLLGSQFATSGKNLAIALSNVDWSIDWLGIDFFFPGLFTSNLKYSYSVVSNPNVLGGEIDFRRQISPTFSFGFRFGYQKIKEPLVVEIRIEDQDPFFSFSYERRAAVDEAKLTSMGIQLHYTKIGKKIDFYLGAIPSIYFVSLSQSLEDRISIGGIVLPVIIQTAKVSGTGIGGMIQSGVKVKIGSAASFFLDGGLELMRAGSMEGQQTTSIFGFVISSGSAVWARDESSFFGAELQETYLILDRNFVNSSDDVAESVFPLTMLKIGLGFGIAF